MNANNAECLRAVEEHVEQRLERAMERNRVLCAEMEKLREKERVRERAQSEAVRATLEAQAQAKSEAEPQLQRLRKKLAILKAEVNRSTREMRDKVEEERQRRGSVERYAGEGEGAEQGAGSEQPPHAPRFSVSRRSGGCWRSSWPCATSRSSSCRRASRTRRTRWARARGSLRKQG